MIESALAGRSDKCASLGPPELLMQSWRYPGGCADVDILAKKPDQQADIAQETGANGHSDRPQMVRQA